eukprot:11187015-Lingulodinium_polyedra.AAC.1
MRKPLLRRNVDLTTSSRNVRETLRNDAVGMTLHGRNGSQIARSRTPRENRKSVCAWNAQTCDA